MSVELENATVAARLANEYLVVLSEYLNKNSFTTAKKSREYIEGLSNQYLEKLNIVEEALKRFQEKHHLVSLNAQTEGAIRLVSELKARLLLREMERDSLLKSSTLNSPEIKRMEDEIVSIKTQLTRLETGTESLLMGMKAGELTNEVALTSGGLASAPQLILDYYRLRRDVELTQKVYELLMQQLSMARITEQNETVAFRVVDPAIIPLGKFKPNRKLYGVAGATCGFFIASLLMLFHYISTRRNSLPATQASSEIPPKQKDCP